jgi:hypothetical protein
MNADSVVRLDDLALNAIALPAMASTAHGCIHFLAAPLIAALRRCC